MEALPETEEETLLVRTDYSNDATWEMVVSEVTQMDPAVRAALQFSEERNRAFGRPPGKGKPLDEIGTPLCIIDDRDYENATHEQIVSAIRPDSDHSFLFIVDKRCIEHPEHPLLVVDLYDEPGKSFRAIPSQIFGIQSNLSLANMDWEEFAENVDQDGVFRGFH